MDTFCKERPCVTKGLVSTSLAVLVVSLRVPSSVSTHVSFVVEGPRVQLGDFGDSLATTDSTCWHRCVDRFSQWGKRRARSGSLPVSTLKLHARKICSF